MNGLAEDDAPRRPAATGPRSGVQERVHAATLELLQESSYRGLTVEAIAARARASKATIYRWWPSKAAIAADALVALNPVTYPDSSGDVRADLVAVAEQIVDRFTSSRIGPVIGSVAWDVLGDDDGGAQFRRGFHAPLRARLREVFGQAIERGQLPPSTDLDLMLDTVAGGLHYRAVFSEQALDQPFIEGLVDQVLAGARATGARAGD